MSKRLLIVAGSLAAFLALTVGVWAYFTSTGTGTATASTGNLSAPGKPNVPATAGTVNLSWSAAIVSNGGTVKYHVERRNDPGSTWTDVCSSSDAAPITATNCSDAPGNGTFVYRVTARFASWHTQGPESDPVTINGDTTAPYVLSIDRAGSSPTNAGTVDWTVTFSESVTGVDMTDFTLVRSGGLTGGSVTSVTGSGATRTVSASTGSGDGSLGLNLVDNNSIVDGASNPLGNSAGGANGNFTGQTYTIDKTGPSVTINQAAGQADPTGVSPINFTVVFSEVVTGFATGDVTLAGTAGATTATVTGSGTTYNVAVSGMTVTGSVTATVGAANATDAVGNANVASTSTDNTVTYNGAPTVSSIARDDPSPTNAGPVHWTVTFSETVTGVDTTDFAVASSGLGGSPPPGVTNVSGSGSSYTVTARIGTTGSGTLGLNLVDNDSIVNGAGTKLGGTGTTGAGDGSFTGEVYTIDRIAPTLSSINRADGNPANAGPLHWIVTFSEPVNNVATGNFTLATSGLGGTAPSISSASAVGGAPSASWTVTVSTTGTTTASGSIGLNLTSTGTIQDAATNPLSATTPVVGQAYSYDTVAPTVSSINRAGGSQSVNSGPLTWTVTFSEPVNGLTTGNFALATTGTAGTAPSITSATATGGAPSATWTVSVATTGTTGTNAGSIGLNLANATNVKDVATNNLSTSTFTGQTYAYDTTTPTVSSINRVTASPTNAASVQWTVTFSESVSGVTAGNFSLASGGGLGGTPAITNVTGSGTTWTVTSSTGSGDGTLGLNQTSNTAVTDAAGNSLGGTLTGQVYALERTAPTLTSINRTGGSATVNSGPLSWTVTFSEPVNGVTTSNFVLATSGTGGTAPTITSATASGGAPSATWTVTSPVTGTTGTNAGSIGLNLANATNVKDVATNNLATSTFTGQAYSYDTTAPTLTSINIADPSPTKAAALNWTVTFSEPVNGVTNSNFALATSGLAGTAPSITSTTATGGAPSATWTVSVSSSGTTGTNSGSIGLNLANATNIKDVATNNLSATTPVVGQTYVFDTAAPTLSTLQFFDGNSNGKIDQIVVTYNESLNTNYTAPNNIWALSSAPMDVAINSVSIGGTSNTQAILTLNEGTGFDTAASGIKLALTTNANGVRDVAGNQAPTFGATAVVDRAEPVLLTASSTGGTANQMQAADTMDLLFSEPLAPASVPSSATVMEMRSGGATALTIPNVIQSAPIANSYLGGNNSSGTATGAITLTNSNKTIHIVLGTVTTTGSGVGTGAGGATVKPAGTITDVAANGANATANALCSPLF
jgi:hypothetical protein